jgi:RNA polymerase sigma factor (sigma-70 family)
MPSEREEPDPPGLAELIDRARAGDAAAWAAVVDRFTSLLWSVCRRHRLSDADAEDVCATVWLRLVERLDTIRTVEALPGWLSTTTARECLAVLRRHGRVRPVDGADLDGSAETPDMAAGLIAEAERSALRLAFADLPERCRRLLGMLFADPPPAYTQVSAAMEMPVGAIGPTRQRCLDRLRRSPFLARLRSGGVVGSGGLFGSGEVLA